MNGGSKRHQKVWHSLAMQTLLALMTLHRNYQENGVKKVLDSLAMQTACITDLLDCLPSEQEAFPPTLQALPDIEVTVHNQDGWVDPAPRSKQRFLQPVQDHEHGNDKLHDASDCPSQVDNVIQVLPWLTAYGVVHEECVDHKRAYYLWWGEWRISLLPVMRRVKNIFITGQDPASQRLFMVTLSYWHLNPCLK